MDQPAGAAGLRATIRFDYQSLPYGLGKNLDETEAPALLQTLEALIRRAQDNAQTASQT
jgi:hypothetical protein